MISRHKVFWCCNGGDYYSDRNCPFDGWSRPDLQRLFVLIAQMKENAELVSISALQKKGFGKEVFDKVIVVEFGGEAAAFDAFHPEGYVIEGRCVPISKLGCEHT